VKEANRERACAGQSGQAIGLHFIRTYCNENLRLQKIICSDLQAPATSHQISGTVLFSHCWRKK